MVDSAADVAVIALVLHFLFRLTLLSFFDFNDIWRVGRGRWVMHDGMQYDQIQSQGHEPFSVWNPSVFNGYLFHHLLWELATDHGFLNYCRHNI